MSLVIDTPEKHARLVSLLEQDIVDDCAGGRQFLAEKKKTGELDQLSTALQTTLAENIEIREAALRELSQKMQAASGKSLTLDDFYTEFVLSLANATRRDSRYYDLFFGMIRRDDLPEDVRRGIMGAAGNAPKAAELVAAKMRSLRPEDIKTIPFRQKTIERVVHLAFEAFYLAASGEQKIDPHRPDYRAFTEAVNERLFGPNALNR